MSTLDRILKVNLDEIVSERYANYAKYIIQERALPDARDGLKPVQRRILFAMSELGLTHEKAFKKSARIVGEVIGKYHPHGDTSVYDALVRMSQPWKVNHPLIEMHGNKGSVDGDSPAAMRYTETRLSHISSLLLESLGEETVPFVLNFDDSEREPKVLPALFPNLLTNGSTGIASGYATNMPPHNLNEIVEALVHRIDYPECSVDDLLKHMQGPDFPTGGIIHGESGIKQAFETGKGRIGIQSKWTWEPFNKKLIQMVITEIPYEVNKSDLVRKIDEIRYSKELPDIVEVRDETDRTGMRIAIDVKKDADTELIEKYLLKKTQLQITYSINNVAIINRKPVMSSLPKLLDSYLNHQREVLFKQSEFLLAKSLKRQETLNGIVIAIDNVDLTIQTIRESKNRKEAEAKLVKVLNISPSQAKDVTELKLYRLTSLDTHTFQKELKDLKKLIEDLNLLLTSDKARRKRIKKQLRRIKLEFGQERKSPINGEIEIISIDEKDLIKKENVKLTVSQEGYIKRVNLKSASKTEETGYREGDVVISVLDTDTQQTALLFTNFGNYVFMPIHKIIEHKWKDVGSHINEYMTIHPDEKVIYSTVVKDFENNNEKILIATKKGLIKQTELSSLKVTRDSKTYPYIIFKDPKDQVVGVQTINNKDLAVLATRSGKITKYPIDEISLVGTRAAGVKSITLDQDDYVVGSAAIKGEDSTIMLFSNKGLKRIKSSAIPLSKRGKKPTQCVKLFKTSPIKLIDVKSTKRNDVFVIFGQHINAYVSNSEVPIMTMDSGVSSLKAATGKIIAAYKFYEDPFVPEEEKTEEAINDKENLEQIKMKI